MLFHRGGEAGFVQRDIAFAADVGGQVEREAVGVVQREGGGAVQVVRVLGQLRFQDLHAVFERLAEPFFFRLQHLHHALLGAVQFRIGAAHLDVQVLDQLVEERLGLAQLVAMAQRAADNAAQDVAMAFAARDDAVDDQEAGRADMVGDDLQRIIGQVGGAGLACGGA